MSPDVKLKNYYLKYIYDAKADIAEYKNNLKEILDLKNELIDYLNNNKVKILNEFNIDLDEYEIEWIKKEYNVNKSLFNISYKLLTILADSNINQIPIVQILKYCSILHKEYLLNRSIEIANTRANIQFKVYKEYVTIFFNKVHKNLLEGNGYRFSNGMGTFCINRWLIDTKSSNYKPIVDFDATRKRKKELLDAGIKLYNEDDAKLYKSKGIPYDGVKYTIYKDTDTYYEFTFIKSIIFNNNLEYKRTEYVNKSYRGLSYQEIADKYCKNIEDIYKLQVDIKYKLNILIYLYPNKYINFIRNINEKKYRIR